mgnify:CR=1 FL=1
MSETIRILGIAPYEAMKTAMCRLAQGREELEADVYVGDMQAGAEIVRRHADEYYDAIISRGGTAELIEQITDIPVVEISLSVYDILRAMKLAENYEERYAIVGFPSITESAHFLCDLLRYQIDIFTIRNEEEAEDTLKRLRKEGYRMVVCDMISYTKAKEQELNAILITSGVESIESAFDQALKISASYTRAYQENLFLKNVLKNAGNSTVIFDEKGDVYLSLWEREREDQVLELLRKDLPRVLAADSHKIFRNIEGTLFSIVGRVIPHKGKRYVVFYFTESKIPITHGKYGIRFFSKWEAEEAFFNSFYSITGAMGGLADTIWQISQSTFPVMIVGEKGTGKEQIAKAIYIKSALCANPLVTIDCGQLTDKGWNYLMNHYNSPFNDSDNTLYIKNVDTLSAERSRQLLTAVTDMKLHTRNRLIFSCVSSRNMGMPAEGQNFVKQLSCLTICLPPLRERIHELPTLMSIYLGTLNVSLGKQLIGVEPRAMEMMQNYNWPQNYTQFKRLMNELAVLTDTPYITSNSVAALLDRERSFISAEPERSVSPSLDLNRPLEDINRDIIKKALADNQGNQSATAKQLGISRTTLWRYLKQK